MSDKKIIIYELKGKIIVSYCGEFTESEKNGIWNISELWSGEIDAMWFCDTKVEYVKLDDIKQRSLEIGEIE